MALEPIGGERVLPQKEGKREGNKVQNGTLKTGRGGTRYLPYAFTEQGVAMLSGAKIENRTVFLEFGGHNTEFNGIEQ